MKKFLSLVFAIMIISAVFVSCADNVEHNGVSSIEINPQEVANTGSKGLQVVVDQNLATAGVNTYYWRYTATKKDSFGKEGQKTAETKFKASGTGVAKLENLSTGTWTFEIFGYSDSGCSKRVYEGKVEDVVLSADKTNTLELPVHRSQVTAQKGTLKIDPQKISVAEDSGSVFVTKNDTKMTRDDVTAERTMFGVLSNYVFTVTECDADGNDIRTLINKQNKATYTTVYTDTAMTAGVHYIKFVISEDYVDNSNQYIAVVAVNIYSNCTTEIKDTDTDKGIKVKRVKEFNINYHDCGGLTATLPAAYQAVEWIQSAAGQYIDTEVCAGSDVSVKLDYAFVGDIANNYIFGYKTNNNDLYGLLTYSTNGYYYCYFGQYVYTNRDGWSGNIGKVVDYDRHETIIVGNVPSSFGESNSLYLDGVKLGKVPVIAVPNKQTEHLGLMSMLNGATPQSHMNGTCKVWGCQIEEGGKLVRNFVPCRGISGADSGKIGMYDTVNGKFYPNLGTGSFTKGADITADGSFSGTHQGSAPRVHQYGKAEVLDTPTKEGKIFAGYYRHSIPLPSEAAVTTIPAYAYTDIDLYAQWVNASTIVKTINYNANTGAKAEDTAVQYVLNTDTTIKLKKNPFSNAGKVFVGWNTQPDGRGTWYGDEYNVAVGKWTGGNNVTLYAQWSSTSVSTGYFTAVNYLKNNNVASIISGGQCIDTGIKCSNVVNFRIDYESLVLQSDWICGAKVSVSGYNRFYGFIYYDSTNASARMIWGCGGENPWYKRDGAPVDANRHEVIGVTSKASKFKVSGGSLAATWSGYVDGVKGGVAISNTLASINYNFYIMGSNNGLGTGPGAWCKMYSCQIEENGVMVRNFVPCTLRVAIAVGDTTHAADSTVAHAVGERGMWDLVNDKFYGRIDTGNTSTTNKNFLCELD